MTYGTTESVPAPVVLVAALVTPAEDLWVELMVLSADESVFPRSSAWDRLWVGFSRSAGLTMAGAPSFVPSTHGCIRACALVILSLGSFVMSLLRKSFSSADRYGQLGSWKPHSACLALLLISSTGRLPSGSNGCAAAHAT